MTDLCKYASELATILQVLSSVLKAVCGQTDGERTSRGNQGNGVGEQMALAPHPLSARYAVRDFESDEWQWFDDMFEPL